MKKILLFGAGKSATFLINYLLDNAVKENWELTVVDANAELANSKTSHSPSGHGVSFDINLEPERAKYISQSDLVISLLPPTLHYMVAKDCITYGKNLLTASYVDENISSLRSQLADKEILFLCEMGLDPGIDHMSAMRLIDGIHEQGGKVISFKSHCGGLVAPESDDNPWHYKISWNPRNIVLAGKAGAIFRENGNEKKLNYEEIFDSERLIEIENIGFLSWYPNRDSLSYAPLYGLEDADTFVRTTLRHPDFLYGWKNVIDLKLTDEIPCYETDGKVLSDFFKEHMEKNGFSDWLQQKLMERFSQTKSLLENLMKLMEAEEEVLEEGEEIPENLMMVDKKGELEDVTMDEIKNTAAGIMAHKMHEANLTLKQLFYLGMDDDETEINKGFCSSADVLQLALEKKLPLQQHDQDMVVMLHEVEYMVGSQKSEIRSSMVIKGEDGVRTAMAKTVGLPLGIAAKLILNGQIKLTGLHIPTTKIIYEPVMAELEANGIIFHETVVNSQ
jgi:saccharopine dehydrogenase-like NADP-dependent oxidoreductase